MPLIYLVSGSGKTIANKTIENSRQNRDINQITSININFY